MLELREQARGRWRSILPMLGMETSFLSGKQGPCPKCGGKDRFRFDDKEGDGTWICNTCGAGDGAKLAMMVTGMGFKDMAERVREALPGSGFQKPRAGISDEQALKLRRDIYRQSVPIRGTMAEAYLRHRGWIGEAPACLRFVAEARAPHDQGTFPAMIAMVSATDGSIVNIHRTFLQDGRKAPIEQPRAMMSGKVPAGSAIRLSDVQEHIGIAEGIETALAATRQFGVPCWSAVNSTLLEQFQPPEGVAKITIYGDNDAKFGGQASAYRLAHRLATQQNPIEVRAVEIPYTTGQDWADCAVT